MTTLPKPSSETLGPLQRAISVLRSLASGGRRGVPLTELAQHVGLAHSTVHRLLGQMVSEGLAQQDPDTRRYTLGPLAFELGLAAEQQFDVRGLCRPTLEKLAQDAEDTAYLVIRSRHEAVCIDRQEGPSPIRVLTLEVGSRRPLGLGAGGLAILAAIPDEEREDMLALLKPRIEKQWRFPEDSLERSIDRARQDGYALIRNRITAGTTAIGVHVKDSLGRPIAALSVAAVNDRMGPTRVERVHGLLKNAVRDLEALLAGKKARQR